MNNWNHSDGEEVNIAHNTEVELRKEGEDPGEVKGSNGS